MGFVRQRIDGIHSRWATRAIPHNLHVYDGNLYVAGNFGQAGGQTANGVAVWDGSSWNALGDGFDQEAYCIGTYRDVIYAGGQFTASGGTPLDAFARWNGSAWESAGFGFSSESAMDFTFVHTLKVIDDMLFIAGGFDQVVLDDGTIIPCGSVVAWDGDSIHTFNGGVVDKDLEAVAPYEDGYLFGGGVFGQGYIAQWTEEEPPLSITTIQHEIGIWPNPGNGLFNLEWQHDASERTRAEIFNLTGGLVYSQNLAAQEQAQTTTLSLNHLAEGTYLLRLTTGNRVYIEQLVIQH